MNRIERFSGFVRKIYELKVDYLDTAKQRKIELKDISEIRKTLGKIFKDAPITTGKSYGLKFEKLSETDKETKYKVVFPKDFFNYFLVNYSGNLYGNEHPAYQLRIKPERQKMLAKYKDDIRNPLYLDWVNELTVEDILTDTIKIEREKPHNRTHFPGGVPEELRGIGLGYIIYEEFIKFLGYASSDRSASDLSQKIWSQIIEDKDFLPVNYKMKTPDGIWEIVSVFYRGFKGDASKVIFDFVEFIKQKIEEEKLKNPDLVFEILEVDIDKELLAKYPSLKNLDY